jgi:hypothetical protein
MPARSRASGLHDGPWNYGLPSAHPGRYTSTVESQGSMLTFGERVLLLVHCGDHPVAGCSGCGELIRCDSLAIDTASGRGDSCPRCQLDLTAPLRRHLVECTWIRVQVRDTHTRAWVLLEEARRVGKISEQHCGGNRAFTLTHADLLHSRNGGPPKVVRPGGPRMHRGRYAAIAAAAVAIITASVLGDRPTLDAGRYGVSREHAAPTEATSRPPRIERSPSAKSSRPRRAVRATTPRVVVPAVPSATVTSPTQVLHQAP